MRSLQHIAVQLQSQLNSFFSSIDYIVDSNQILFANEVVGTTNMQQNSILINKIENCQC